jgi:hypothetical protein
VDKKRDPVLAKALRAIGEIEAGRAAVLSVLTTGRAMTRESMFED